VLVAAELWDVFAALVLADCVVAELEAVGADCVKSQNSGGIMSLLPLGEVDLADAVVLHIMLEA
jgi:hypothetical protein